MEERKEQACQREKQQIDKERGELIEKAVAELNKCLMGQTLELVKYSTENAETVATTVIELCSDGYKKIRSLFRAFYGADRRP